MVEVTPVSRIAHGVLPEPARPIWAPAPTVPLAAARPGDTPSPDYGIAKIMAVLGLPHPQYFPRVAPGSGRPAMPRTTTEATAGRQRKPLKPNHPRPRTNP